MFPKLSVFPRVLEVTVSGKTCRVNSRKSVTNVTVHVAVVSTSALGDVVLNYPLFYPVAPQTLGRQFPPWPKDLQVGSGAP